LVQFVGGALDTLEIFTERARDGLVHGAGRVGVVWHADIDGFSREIARFVILEARCLGVNYLRVPLCPEVPQLIRIKGRQLWGLGDLDLALHDVADLLL
jgi:hypothetical protein